MILTRISIQIPTRLQYSLFWVCLLGVAILICTQLRIPQKAVAQTNSEENQSVSLFALSTNLQAWNEVTTPNHEHNFWSNPNEETVTAEVLWGRRQSMLIPKASNLPHDWNELWKWHEYSFEVTQQAGADVNFLFDYQDTANWYEVHIKYGMYQIVRVQDGKPTFWVFGELHFEKNKTYQVTIRNTGHLKSLFINGELIGTHEDWTYNEESHGVVGLRATTGSIYPTKISYKNLVVKRIKYVPDNAGEQHTIPSTTIDGFPIHYTPHFKQTDPMWKDHTYNNAHLWSKTPTMARWGCLTTSMAMILRYYGIDSIPTTDPNEPNLLLTPATLNDWLRSQPDGYIGNGLFNWVAATRLTRIISEKKNTPKLEYSIYQGNSLKAAHESLAQRKPVIFNIPGHFFVGMPLVNRSSAEDSTNDTFHKNKPIPILDPYHDFQTLQEQYAFTETDLASTRILSPSQTDLSYFVFVHPPEIKISLSRSFFENSPTTDTTHFSQEIPLILVQDWIKNPDYTQTEKQSTQQSTNQVVSVLPKPKVGSYTMHISAAAPAQYTLDLYAYDQDANPIRYVFSRWVTTYKTNIDLQYIKTNHLQSVKKTQFTHSYLLQDLIQETQLLLNMNIPWHIKAILNHILLILTSKDSMEGLSQIEIEQEKRTSISNIISIWSWCLPADIIDFFTDRLELLAN